MKQIEEAKKEAERIIETLVSELEEIISSIEEMIEEVEESTKDVLDILKRFITIAMEKFDVESFIPDELEDLLDKLKKLKEKAESEDEEVSEEDWEELRDKAGSLKDYVLIDPIPGFGGRVYIAVGKSLDKIEKYKEQADESFSDVTKDNKDFVKAVKKIQSQLEKANGQVNKFKDSVNMQSKEFYKDLANLVVESGEISESEEISLLHKLKR